MVRVEFRGGDTRRAVCAGGRDVTRMGALEAGCAGLLGTRATAQRVGAWFTAATSPRSGRGKSPLPGGADDPGRKFGGRSIAAGSYWGYTFEPKVKETRITESGDFCLPASPGSDERFRRRGRCPIALTGGDAAREWYPARWSD